MLRKKGAMRVGTTTTTAPSAAPSAAAPPALSLWSADPSRACGRCRAELGRIMNRGAFCKACRARVCKGCREYNARGTDWICTVCHKLM